MLTLLISAVIIIACLVLLLLLVKAGKNTISVGKASTSRGIFDKKQSILFDEQFANACSQIASSLVAGITIDRALLTIAELSQEPLKGELSLVCLDIRCGSSVEDGLRLMAKRTGNKNVEFLATTVGLNTRRGGKLADTLLRLSATIKKKHEMIRLIKSESANGKTAAKAVVAITAFLILFQAISNASFLQFYSRPIGIFVGLLSLVLIITGCFWMYKSCKIDCD